MRMPVEAADGRLHELDSLRGIAALIVLVHHALHLLPAGAGFGMPETTPLRVFESGRPAVLFFFVLSGFVLTRGLMQGVLPTGILPFAVQRSIRILIPAAVALLLSLGLRSLSFDYAEARTAPGYHLWTWFLDPTPLRLAAELMLLRNDFNVVLWSLAHEWRLTLLLPLVLLFRGRALTLLALAGLATALGLLLGAEENEVFLPREPFEGMAATLYFTLGVGTGVALALAGPLPVLTREQRWAAAGGTVAAFSLYSDIASYAGSVLLILLAVQPGRMRDALRGRLPVALGRVSFSLYLVHVPVLLATWHLLDPATYGTWAVALGVLLSLAAAPVFWWLVEEPVRKLSKRLGQGGALRPRKLRQPG